MLISLTPDDVVVATFGERGWTVLVDGVESGPHLSVMVAPESMTIGAIGTVGPEVLRIATSSGPVTLVGEDAGLSVGMPDGVTLNVAGAVRFITTSMPMPEPENPDAPV
jgi:hypothetical protein